jgi:hypothetical protein
MTSSILQDLIPEAIPGQESLMKLGQNLNGYVDTGIWNVA